MSVGLLSVLQVSTLRRDLVRMRVGLTARRVIWLLPYARSNAAIVNSIAISFATSPSIWRDSRRGTVFILPGTRT